MSTFFNDIKYGVRQMRKNPGFTVTAVIVLSLAIGGTTAMFTLVNALLLRPLPVRNPNQLVRLYAKENKPGGAYQPDEELREAGSRAIRAIGRPLLYARVDLVYLASGRPAVMELELIEPSLYFPYNAESPRRFAQALHQMNERG